jgi:hypothetical protein
MTTNMHIKEVYVSNLDGVTPILAAVSRDFLLTLHSNGG